MVEERKDDFEKKRKKLKDLDKEELNSRFWELAEEIVDPLINMADEYTSPSIERSVLLRMGFDSLEAKAIVNKINSKNLLGKGAGNVILKLAERENIDIHKAGKEISDGKFDDSLVNLFGGE